MSKSQKRSTHRARPMLVFCVAAELNAKIRLQAKLEGRSISSVGEEWLLFGEAHSRSALGLGQPLHAEHSTR